MHATYYSSVCLILGPARVILTWGILSWGILSPGDFFMGDFVMGDFDPIPTVAIKAEYLIFSFLFTHIFNSLEILCSKHQDWHMFDYNITFLSNWNEEYYQSPQRLIIHMSEGILHISVLVFRAQHFKRIENVCK